MRGLRRRKEDNSKKIEASQSFTIHLSNLVNYKDVQFINSYSFNFTFEYVQLCIYCCSNFDRRNSPNQERRVNLNNPIRKYIYDRNKPDLQGRKKRSDNSFQQHHKGQRQGELTAQLETQKMQP